IPEFLNFSENTRYLYSSEFAGVLNFAYSFGANKLTLKSLYTTVFRKNFIKRDSVFNPAVFDFPELGISGFAYRTEQRGLINSILAGEHKTGRNKETQLDWNINVSTNNINLPDTRNFLLSINEKGNYSFINRGIGLEQSLATSSRVWNKSKDLITGGAFNLSSVFNLFNVKQVVKGGILFQTRRRVSTGTGLVLEGINNFPLDSILAPSAYLRGVTIGSVGNALESSGNYNANTSLQAVYESIENRIGKYTRVIWGVRFENYQQSVNVFNLSFDPNFITPEYVPGVFASRTALDFLPSVNIIYSPLNTINFRGAFSQTVIRPDLQDIAQYTRYDFQTFQLTGGNVNIKSTNISNYDLKFEWFPSAGEIFSLSAFYKEMENPIEYAQTTQENVLVGNIAINSGNTVVKGVEAEFRKRLNFISFAKWMENVTLFGNAALIRSRVAATAVDAPFVSFSPEHRLSGQPDYILNGGISIAAFKKSFEATLSFNRTGDYVDDLGGSIFVP
ncbi:MAG: TonB-dependent receptor, partial [Pyrinomonadaceae bacterium]|nr:TonB-dependent receptor [Sphingobacteriaceae bacterium]